MSAFVLSVRVEEQTALRNNCMITASGWEFHSIPTPKSDWRSPNAGHSASVSFQALCLPLIPRLQFQAQSTHNLANTVLNLTLAFTWPPN